MWSRFWDVNGGNVAVRGEGAAEELEERMRGEDVGVVREGDGE